VAQWFEDTRDDWVAMMEANEASLQSVWRQHVPSV